MLVILGGIVGQASGRIGASVASHNRYGSYFRNGTIPITSTTTYALAAKARMTEASQAWQQLTVPQKTAWAQWAQTNPVVNKLGQPITLTGHVAYIGLNTRLIRMGVTKIDDPPMDPAPAPLTFLAITADIGAGEVEATFLPEPTGANIGLRLWACVTDSAGINYVKNLLRHVTDAGGNTPSPWGLESNLTGRFGQLQVGQYVHVEIGTVDRTNGQVSALLRATSIVTTT